jgi:RHS repeat-associated protein
MAYSLLIGYKGEMKPITSTATAALPDDLPLLDIVNINFMGATNVYDGNGSMVKSVIDDVSTYYIGGYYELKIDGTTETETETKYYTGPTGRFAMRVDGTLYWIFSDHLQSSSVILSEVGWLVSRTDYTAFGEVRAETGTSPTNYTYTGQRSYTDDFGLMFYNARWYDPVTAHFAQADSIIPQPGNSADWNRYAYVLYNPMRYIDPTGHIPNLLGPPPPPWWVPRTPTPTPPWWVPTVGPQPLVTPVPSKEGTPNIYQMNGDWIITDKDFAYAFYSGADASAEILDFSYQYGISPYSLFPFSQNVDPWTAAGVENPLTTFINSNIPGSVVYEFAVGLLVTVTVTASIVDWFIWSIEGQPYNNYGTPSTPQCGLLPCVPTPPFLEDYLKSLSPAPSKTPPAPKLTTTVPLPR